MLIPAHGTERGVLSSWPRPYSENPYLSRLAASLAARGITTRSARYLASLCARPRGSRWLHVHWPEWMIRDEHRLRGIARARWFDALIGAARARGVRIAWTAHNLVGHDDPHPDLARAARERWLAACDVVFGHFPGAERDVRAMGFRGRFALTPHPHVADDYPPARERSLTRASLGYTAAHRVLVAFGAIEPYKGFDRLAAAFRAHAPEHARLVVVGRASSAVAVRALRDASAGDARIRIEEGFLSRERVADIVSAADALVCSYRAFYTSGTAMLALTYGTPVIGPPVHHLATLRDAPFFVACEEPDRLASVWARIEALDDAARAGARTYAMTQTWQNVAATIDTTLFGEPEVSS
jgi:glycosyltransferase involved in cell wall biosynthesis